MGEEAVSSNEWSGCVFHTKRKRSLSRWMDSCTHLFLSLLPSSMFWSTFVLGLCYIMTCICVLFFTDSSFSGLFHVVSWSAYPLLVSGYSSFPSNIFMIFVSSVFIAYIIFTRFETIQFLSLCHVLFKVMVPEAFAIVVAPTDSSRYVSDSKANLNSLPWSQIMDSLILILLQKSWDI